MDYYVRYEENGTVCNFSEEIHNLEQEIIKLGEENDLLMQKIKELEQKLAKAVEIIKIIKLKKDIGWLFTYDDMVELNNKLKELGG